MQKITVARGNGIGTEIMSATLDVIKAAGARLEYEFIDEGIDVIKTENLYEFNRVRGYSLGQGQ